MPATSVGRLCAFLESIDVPHYRLGGPATGSAVVVREGGRVIALCLPSDDENIFWTNPKLRQCRTAAEFAQLGGGGPGGLRLWQAPEASFMWKGPADPKTFTNYAVQPAMDPGAYAFGHRSPHRCELEAEVQLQNYQTNAVVRVAIRRTIELVPSPAAYSQSPNRRAVTLRLSHHARLLQADQGARVDLWHLIQLPPHARLGLPVSVAAKPTIYFNEEKATGWSLTDGLFTWPANGSRMAKVGFARRDVTGGPFGIQIAGDRHRLLLWDIPLASEGSYVDAPPGRKDTDQVVQFWDGFGFCEMEYHTAALSQENPVLNDSSELTYLDYSSADFTERSLRALLRSH